MDRFTKIYNEAIPAGQGLKPKPAAQPGAKKPGNFLAKVGKVANAITTGQQIAKGQYNLGGLESLSGDPDFTTDTPSTTAQEPTQTPAQQPQFNNAVAAATPRVLKPGDVVEYKTNAGSIKRAVVIKDLGNGINQIRIGTGPVFGVPITRIGKKLGVTPK